MFGSFMPANETAWVPLFQRPMTTNWVFLASGVKVCEVDVSQRRTATERVAFFQGTLIDFDPSIECISFPVAMFDAIANLVNASCRSGAERYRSRGCVVPRYNDATLRLFVYTHNPAGVLEIFLPSNRNSSVCLQAHNATTDFESVRIGYGTLGSLRMTINAAASRIGLLNPAATARAVYSCPRPQCSAPLVYQPRTNLCVDVQCEQIWFKRWENDECRNSPTVLAVIVAAIVVIAVGEAAAHQLRRMKASALATLPPAR